MTIAFQMIGKSGIAKVLDAPRSAAQAERGGCVGTADQLSEQPSSGFTSADSQHPALPVGATVFPRAR